MAFTFGFYADAGLTVPLTRLAVTQNAAGGAAVNSSVYFGSTAPAKLLQAASQPGLDVVTIRAIDADESHGISTSAIQLGLTSAWLDSGYASSAIDLPAIVHSGVANAIRIYVRVTTPALPPSVYSDISLSTIDVVEVDEV